MRDFQTSQALKLQLMWTRPPPPKSDPPPSERQAPLWKRASLAVLGETYVVESPKKSLKLIRRREHEPSAPARDAIQAPPLINRNPTTNALILNLLTTGEEPNGRPAISDDDAIRYEEDFEKRFGFVWPHYGRVGLIDLKHRCDLTDRELKFLRLSSAIRLKPHGVTVWVPPFEIYLALMLITFMLIVTAFPAASVSVKAIGTALKVKAGATSLLTLVYCYIVYVFGVRPTVLWKRARYRASLLRAA